MIYLNGTQINAGLEEVAKLQQLKELGLNDTQITDESLKEVTNLKNHALDLLAPKSG